MQREEEGGSREKGRAGGRQKGKTGGKEGEREEGQKTGWVGGRVCGRKGGRERCTRYDLLVKKLGKTKECCKILRTQF